MSFMPTSYFIDANRPSVTIAAEQRMEYNSLMEQIQRQATEIENKLAMLYVYTRKEDIVRRIIAIVRVLILLVRDRCTH